MDAKRDKRKTSQKGWFGWPCLQPSRGLLFSVFLPRLMSVGGGSRFWAYSFLLSVVGPCLKMSNWWEGSHFISFLVPWVKLYLSFLHSALCHWTSLILQIILIKWHDSVIVSLRRLICSIKYLIEFAVWVCFLTKSQTGCWLKVWDKLGLSIQYITNIFKTSSLIFLQIHSRYILHSTSY